MVEIFLQSFPNFSNPLRNRLCSCIVQRPMLLPPSPCCGYTGAPSASPSYGSEDSLQNNLRSIGPRSILRRSGFTLSVLFWLVRTLL